MASAPAEPESENMPEGAGPSSPPAPSPTSSGKGTSISVTSPVSSSSGSSAQDGDPVDGGSSPPRGLSGSSEASSSGASSPGTPTETIGPTASSKNRGNRFFLRLCRLGNGGETCGTQQEIPDRGLEVPPKRG